MREAFREAFREALIRHIKEHDIGLAELSRQTGVSKSLIDALHQRKTMAPNVADALTLADFFGKSIEDFIGRNEYEDNIKRIRELVGQLPPFEVDLLLRQIRSWLERPKSGK